MGARQAIFLPDRDISSGFAIEVPKSERSDADTIGFRIPVYSNNTSNVSDSRRCHRGRNIRVEDTTH